MRLAGFSKILDQQFQLIRAPRSKITPIFAVDVFNRSWIGPKRFHPSAVTAEELPDVDVVLITHDHYDHLEKSTLVTINENFARNMGLSLDL